MAARNWTGRAITGLLAALALMTQAVGQTAFTPVTDAMIQNPDPADWLSWRRTLDSWGYSPLDQINRTNVNRLRLVWARPLDEGHQEGTPLVHDGVLYFPGPADSVQAIDARSGVVLWHHRRKVPADIGDYLPVWNTNRNLAIHGNLIIARGSDDTIYALDARTGEPAWETVIMDYRHGAKQSSGPIIAKGLAITGRSCEAEGGPDACVITAHDALTGREVWRTSTIARGSDPNSASWGDVPEDRRIHVGAWMIASYDPELELVYMGTSVTAPAPKFMLAGNDKTYLYHNSTLALDVNTGRIVWHYQHLVDHWDLDHPFPRILLDEEVAPDPAQVAWINPRTRPGQRYKVVTGIPGKTGIVYTLDRATGEFLWARPTVKQTVVESIDGATGRVTVNPAAQFDGFGKPALICPSASGGANYMAPAYSPLTRTIYYPLLNSCGNISAVEPRDDRSPGYAIAGRQFIPEEAQGLLGTIHAVNAVTGRTMWTHTQRAGMQSLLATGGGLIFAGDAEGRLRALDQWTGEVLWEINLGSSITGYPATFAVDGHQYLAVSTGRWLNDSYTPELIHGTQNTLFVFALPEAGTGHRGPVKPFVDLAFFNAADPNLGNRAGRPSRQVGQGVYGAGQAALGKEIYRRACAACHGVDFRPAQGTPPVAGAAFLANWKGKSVGDLYAQLSLTMPPGAGGSLPREDYLALIAYLLEANGFPSGEPLSGDEARLQDIGFGG